ncbi:MAG: type IX secretion system protein PorQ [Vicingaceae bacterium]
MSRFSTFLLSLFCPLLLLAQSGGEKSYQFLNLSSSARVAALGGNQIAVYDDDLFLGLENPSLLNKTMDNKLALTYVDYLSDISYGNAAFAKHIDSIGTFNIGVNYVDYGEFVETDIAGNELGTFTAGEYAFQLGYSRMLDSNFTAGINVKTIYSDLYDYYSLALAADLGISYYSRRREVVLTFLAKNIGTQLSTYSESTEEKLPYELQLGFSKRLSKVPIRLGLIVQHMQQWDLQYDNPNDDVDESVLLDPSQAEEEKEPGFFENAARHIIANAEFLVTDNFNVRIGYNYLRRADLRIDEKLGTVGLSWGLGFRISKFHLSYGRSAFHQAGATNTFSVSSRLSDFIN